MAVHADIVNGDVDVFTSLIKFKYLLPNVQFYVNPVRLLGDRRIFAQLCLRFWA